MENKPITDSALAELRRRFAAATPGEWRMFYGGEPCQVGVGPDVGKSKLVADCDSLSDAEWSTAAHNAFPALLRRLEMVEAERDRALQDIDNYAQAADQYTAARDAQQRREGAAEWLGGYLQGLSAGNPGAPGSMVAMLEAELKRLREGEE